MIVVRTSAVLLLALCTSLTLAENIDPSGDGSQYAYGENVGWLNAEPGGDGGSGIVVDDAGLSGYMWGENVGWVSLSCSNTSSCGAASYGVSNDQGTLAGYAWSENAGWINFAGVTIDPQSGLFAGHAWAENLGWISFEAPWAVRTSWLCATPDAVAGLVIDGGLLSWPAVAGASGYDLLRGDLSGLGDFSTAVTDCLADDQLPASYLSTVDPPAGAGWFYLLRASACASGSYDSAGASQAQPRDAGIAASASACP